MLWQISKFIDYMPSRLCLKCDPAEPKELWERVKHLHLSMVSQGALCYISVWSQKRGRGDTILKDRLGSRFSSFTHLHLCA